MPDWIDHAPVPTVGLFPASVTCVKPHVAEPVWSEPAVAVGVAFKVCVPPADVGPPAFVLIDVKLEVETAFTAMVALLVALDATSIVIQK